MEKEKIVIGIVGEKGGGKETVGNLLIEYLGDISVARVRSSDVLSETLKIWGIPLDRHNLQHLAIVMNQGYGPETLSGAVKNRILTTNTDVVLFDGVRWEADINLVRSFKKHFLVYVTADPKIRYERTKKRKEKVGEESATFEQFMEDEKVATEVLIPVFGKDADFKIVNEGSLEDVKIEVKKVVVDMIKRFG